MKIISRYKSNMQKNTLYLYFSIGFCNYSLNLQATILVYYQNIFTFVKIFYPLYRHDPQRRVFY